MLYIGKGVYVFRLLTGHSATNSTIKMGTLVLKLMRSKRRLWMKEGMVDSQGSHWAPPRVRNGQGEWEVGQGHGISQTPPSERKPYNENNTKRYY